jgi:predicted PurR-regulated permease PerM
MATADRGLIHQLPQPAVPWAGANPGGHQTGPVVGVSGTTRGRTLANVSEDQRSSGSEAHGIPRGSRAPTRPQWIAINPTNARRIVFMVVVAIILLSIANWAFTSTGSFLFLLLLAWLVSIAMEPVVLWLSTRGIRRGLATGLTMLAMILLFAGLVELFGSVFISQLSELGTQFPNAVTAALDWVNSTFNTSIDIEQIKQSLDLTPEKIGELAGTYGGGIVGVFGSLFTFIFDVLTILVFAYYFSADSPKLRQTIGSWLPPRYQRVFITVWTISVEKTGGYVISKLVLATLSAGFHVAFFWFIDVPFWLPLGVFAGIVGQFIPTIGTYIGVALPALFTLLSDPLDALWIIVFATVYQQLENYVFTPKVSRRTMDIHPAIALGSVIAGAALFGPIGALIGIPIAAVALSVLDTFSQRHELLPELASLEEEEGNGRSRNNGPDEHTPVHTSEHTLEHTPEPTPQPTREPEQR